MEGRAILAFVLSLLVFIGWNFLLEAQKKEDAGMRPPVQEGEKIPYAQPAPAPYTGVKELGIVPPTPAPTESPSVTGLREQASDAPFDYSAQSRKAAKEVSVTLKEHKVVFTTAGAGIKSFVSFKYKNLDGGPLELIQTPSGNIPSPQINFDDKNLTMFVGRGIYEASSDQLVLSETNPEGKITFVLNDPSGLSVTKEFSFKYDSYIIGCNVSMKYGQRPIKTLRFSWADGVYSGKDAKDAYTYEGATTLVGKERTEDSKDLKDGPVRRQGDLQWTAYHNKYFALAMIPREKEITAFIEEGKKGIATVSLEYNPDGFPLQKEFSLYLGPKESKRLALYKDISLDRLIDYGWFGNKVGFLVRPLFYFLNVLYNLTGNYGWSIIILTVLIKIIFFPLSHKSFVSMKRMQKIQPEIKILQERYKNDRQMMSQEMMKIYREKKVNPLGGCLPMVLQIPVFIALYHVLLISIELRNAPFMLWISDLSEKDPYFITPLLMGASMFLQQKMTPSMGDPTQQKAMMILPVVFTFLFLNFPSGLVLYWLVNNILTIAQQQYIYKYSNI